LRGLSSEEIAKQYYLKKSYKFLRQRVKTPFAEVDLLFQNPRGHLVLVEVKTSSVSAFREYRVTQRQRERLVRAMLFLAERYQIPVEMNWAFVTKQGVVTVIEDISG